jgi:hypothetical protein
MTQPMAAFSSTDAIDPELEIDERSAIDQFVATIEALNVVLARHSPDAGTVLSPPSVPSAPSDDALESLFAIEPTEEAEQGSAPVAMPHALAGEGVATPAEREDEVTLQLNNLVFLGYMSAVESYLRCLTRQLIWVDEFTAESMQDVKITFGAARHATPGLLPEVLMEDMTFITMDSVKDLLVKMIGVGVGSIHDLIKEYDRICQLRHCIVHRFGRLGSKNAAKLGFGTHGTLIERKIKIRTSQLEALAFNLLNFVKAMNNHIYAGVMKRSAAQSLVWQWDEQSDLAEFERLYTVFRQTSAPGASDAPSRAYAIFKAQCEKGSATQVERAKQANLR